MLDSNATPDLNAMSKSELEARQRQVQEALSKSEARRKKDALKSVEQAAKEFGFSLQNIQTFASGSKPRHAGYSRKLWKSAAHS